MQADLGCVAVMNSVVQPAVLSQEGQGSCFPKKKEIMCMRVHTHERERVHVQ